MNLKEKDDKRASAKVASSLSKITVSSYTNTLLNSTPDLIACVNRAGLSMNLGGIPLNHNDTELYISCQVMVKNLLSAYVALEVAYNSKVKKDEGSASATSNS